MTIHRFAFIADGDVFSLFMVDSERAPEDSGRIIAGMQSNPIVVEIGDDTPVNVGWTYDGKQFHGPVN